jgi:streptomycin 6-kinase
MDAPGFPARWKVSAPELIAESFSSRIWKVVREDGSPAVVKAHSPTSAGEFLISGNSRSNRLLTIIDY